MRPTPEQGPPAESGEGVRPGAISALLQDLIRPEGAPTSAWARGLRAGERIGRFELVREIGRGGFGVVWEARDLILGRTVAFKAIRAEALTGEAGDRVQREAEAAARLSHPNIVTLHDVGSCEHGPFLVLELLRGQTLAQRMAQGRVSVREAVRIAHEIAKGLAHAHAHGVVHRDLTPGNVFLCDDGQVKVLDLGMAHAFGRRKLDGGTPAYMAPEQSQGAPEDERSDVYSLGVVLYRLLTNELPFGDRRKALPAGGAARLDVPEAPGLGDLVARMLARDPVQRPRDARAVRDALAAMQQELERTPSAATVATVRRRLRWPVLATVAVIVLALVTTGVVLVQQRAGARRAAEANASVAVLPFTDMSPQKDQEYFADGLSEEILNALANVEGLRVAGRTSSFAFKGKNEDLRVVGQRLNVTSVLEGSVRKAGNRVRITAQLINLADGFHLWSETFDRELTDIFAVQDEIARAVAGALRGKLLPTQVAARARPTNPEAYTQYLLGKQWYARYTTEGHRRAMEYFEKAIAIDPSYAPAYSALAVQVYNLSMIGAEHGGGEPAAEWRKRAMEAAQKAVLLDPSFGEGYATRGLLRGMIDWDWVGAQSDMDRAIALSPGDATTLRRRALLLGTIGRRGEALENARKATELDPLFAANWLAFSSMAGAVGDWKQAKVALDRAAEISPEYAGLDETRVALLLLEGKAADALRGAKRLKDELARLGGIAAAAHALGRERESQEAFDQFIAKAGKKKPGAVAILYALRGDRDRAFEWLDRAYEQRDGTVTEIKQDWFLHGLKDDPRYEKLLRKLNLPP